MKLRNILLIMVSITMLSCNSTDCNNGIQDGNETGIDCGGDCINCITPPNPAPTTIESQLAHIWYLHYNIYGQDTTFFAPTLTCIYELTLITHPTISEYYIAYNGLGGCSNGIETGWFVNNDGLFNDQYFIEILTADSLHLKANYDGGYLQYRYYK